MKRVGAVTVAAVLLAGCGAGATRTAHVAASSPAPTSSPATVTINGDLTLAFGGSSYPNFTAPSDDSSCSGTNGYSDVAAGTEVTVHDAAGKVIALGQLEGGATSALGALTAADSCLFDFSIFDVPDEKFYGVEIGHRGTVNFSDSDVAYGGVHLTLGR